MAHRDEITEFCNKLLDAPRFESVEYGPNGMQVPGTLEISRVATCVSANLASLEEAVEAGADMVLAHHGIFWKFQSRSLSEQTAARVKCLLESGTSLLAYHLPLDAHREVGNNALLCERLGFEVVEPFAHNDGVAIGWTGTTSHPVAIGDLNERIATLLDREPLLQGKTDGEVSRMGFVSGGGTSFINEAIDYGLDAMLTGEPSEFAMATALEGDLTFWAAGHYATETLGVRALGDLLSGEFGIEHVFVDVPNPV